MERKSPATIWCVLANAQNIEDRRLPTMKNGMTEKLNAVAGALIVGVDIGKDFHWAQFTDCHGIQVAKAMKFSNDRTGFESIVTRIQSLCNNAVLAHPYRQVVVGMEPTGHYWKTLARYLLGGEYELVCVNPYHTKKAKELDDNSQTTSDPKDALTIARLIRDGRYFEPYLSEGMYADLRVLETTRTSVKREENRVKNITTALLDEYFPEIYRVFKKPFQGKASRQILRDCPFPSQILEEGEAGVLTIMRKAVKRGVGVKRARLLLETAKVSVGVNQGLRAARLKLNILLDDLERYEAHLEQIEEQMAEALNDTGYADQLLSIKGVGVVTAASFLGEVGNPMRFQDARQIVRLAGLSLVEDSSGKSKGRTHISKRGRPHLRSLLYTMAMTMVSQNPQMKRLYNYLKYRQANPLKGKQALIVIAQKIITMIFSMLKHGTQYCPEKVLGTTRLKMLEAA